MPGAIRGLLLCGGASTRFGADKLLAPLADGRPMAERSARTLLEGAGDALVVIPPGASRLRTVLEPLGCEILECEHSARGIGASLAAAVRARPHDAGWVVALGDMPFVRADTIAAVCAQLAAGALVAAPVLASGERGHPVGFSHRLYGELAALDGDEGARGVVARHRQALALIAVDDGGILRDIDTPADLAR
jgi:molybdenum cofactor cytidylyltransferase